MLAFGRTLKPKCKLSISLANQNPFYTIWWNMYHTFEGVSCKLKSIFTTKSGSPKIFSLYSSLQQCSCTLLPNLWKFYGKRNYALHSIKWIGVTRVKYKHFGLNFYQSIDCLLLLIFMETTVVALHFLFSIKLMVWFNVVHFWLSTFAEYETNYSIEYDIWVMMTWLCSSIYLSVWDFVLKCKPNR